MAGNGNGTPRDPISTVRKLLGALSVGAVVLMYVAAFFKPEFHPDTVLSLGLLTFATGLIAPELANLRGSK